MDAGIIGGADGPTSIFVSANPSVFLIAAAAVAAVIICVLFYRKSKK